ncbi:ATP-dependent nuclease [Streptococcus suis]
MKIKEIRIKGFKKFKELNVEFNDDVSVIVGENESGKSSLLVALDIVLNQSIFNRSDSSFDRYLNKEEVQDFFDNPSKDTLPRIDIEVFLDFGNSLKASEFSGLHYDNPKNNECRCGIKFEYSLDMDFLNDVNFSEFAQNNVVPIEYYRSSWTTFQGKSYKRQLLSGDIIFLDNSTQKYDLFGGYARSLYNAQVDSVTHRQIASKFKQSLQSFITNQKIELEIDSEKHIGFDSSKTDILKLIDIYENNVSIQDMGKGKENLIKTEVSLSNGIFDVIFIDEPENHLSFTNTRKLINLLKQRTTEQVIIVSHSSLVVSRLDLKNVIWLSDKEIKKLEKLDSDTSMYFSKIDNLDVLRFILAEKVILVEGAAEYIILPAIYEKVVGSRLEADGIEIISMGSISYERYRKIAESLNKKVAVITDNDGKDEQYNNTDLFSIFSDSNCDNWTLEVAFYNKNTEFFDEKYKNKQTKTEYDGKTMAKACAHMLKNKTENALLIESEISSLSLPEYLIEAVQWIKE